MITPGKNPYDVILAEQYSLRELIEEITIEESLDEVAARCSITLAVTPDLPGIVPGMQMAVHGMPFNGSGSVLFLDGIVWTKNPSRRGREQLSLTIYDRAIYLAKSEDEYLFDAGQTATGIIRTITGDWNIPSDTIAETGVTLAKQVFRSQTLYNMLARTLRETAAKGGNLYRLRMSAENLELVQIGANKTVWMLESGTNLQDVSCQQSLDGVVTQVKVLGNAEEEGRSPVMAVVKRDTEKYGTIQKVVQNAKITNAGEAHKAGQQQLAGVEETYTATAIDINTLRAGDRVSLDGTELIVTSIRHRLGSPGQMSLDLASLETVRRRYFIGSSEEFGE
jgi:hypothetical protein